MTKNEKIKELQDDISLLTWKLKEMTKLKEYYKTRGEQSPLKQQTKWDTKHQKSKKDS